MTTNEVSKTFQICPVQKEFSRSILDAYARHYIRDVYYESYGFEKQIMDYSRDLLVHPCSVEAVYSARVKADAKMMKAISSGVMVLKFGPTTSHLELC